MALIQVSDFFLNNLPRYFNWDKPTNQIGIFNWVYD